MNITVKRSKRYQKRIEGLDSQQKHSLAEAIKIVKKIDAKKFDETLTLNFQLGIRTSSGTEMVRGTVSLPNGTGKSVKVLCFVKGAGAKEAQDAGADYVGGEDLVAKIQGGWFDFDVVVAHPDMMREVSKLGKVLGPKKLMPSPKTGTVTPNVAKAVEELKAGRIEFKNDKTGGLHAVCGKLSFSEDALVDNAKTIIKAVKEAKPAGSKGDFFKGVSLSVTQGPGIRLAVHTF